MLTEEAIDNVIEDKEERKVIASRMVPMMLVGGFTSVTFVSVLLASICAGMLAAM